VSKLSAGIVARKVPQSLQAADRIVGRIRRRNQKIEATQAKKAALETGLKRVKAELDKLESANRRDKALVGEFADAHRDELTDGGKKKSFRFPSGGVGKWSYPSSPRLEVVEGKLPTVARLLLGLANWPKYLELRLKKNAIKADLEDLQRIPGLRRWLRLEKDERFYVNP
jgi:phage host-nuclease inhibitor protein Gam